MTPFQHRAWTDAAVATLAARIDVVGVVGMGSTGATSRVDEWSDHDLAVVVEPGAEQRYSGRTDWMPEPERIVGVAREHHGGACALYDDGHVVEWGVASVAGLGDWVADDYAVLCDKGGVAAAMTAAGRRPYPANEPDLARDATLFLCLLLKGVGRARRGERLSAGRAVRTEAVDALVRALRARTPQAHPSLDRLDPMRRLERVMPVEAALIDDALARDVESAARELLRVADVHLGIGEGRVDAAQRAAVMRRLGWSESD